MIFVYLISLFSGTLYGLTESINKNITEKKYSPSSYAFLQWGLNSIFYLIPFIFFRSFPTNITAYLCLAGILFATMAGNLILIKAYKTEDISNISIIARVSLVIAFVSGIVFLQEKVNAYKIFGVISIIVGVIILFYEGKKFKPTSGYLLAFLSGIFYGLTTVFQKIALNYFNIISLIFIFNLSATILLLFIPNTLRDIKPIFKKYKKPILLSRICIVLGTYLFFWSLSRGNISIINTNSETAFLLSTAFMGIIFLNERKNIAKKFAGSLLCTLGIILLNFF